MTRLAHLLLLISIVSFASAQNDFILAFFTDSACNFGSNALGTYLPTSFSVGACQSLPSGSPFGSRFNVTEVGGGFSFNTDCDADCGHCEERNLDLSQCTRIPGTDLWVQWFTLTEQQLFMKAYLDSRCRRANSIPRFPITSGNCTNTGNDLTGHSILSLTTTDQIIISTKCNSDCSSCASMYKRTLGSCIEIIDPILYVKISMSTSTVASLVLVLSLLFALLL